MTQAKCLLLAAAVLVAASSARVEPSAEAVAALKEAEAAHRKGDLDLALAHFTEAIRLDPASARAFTGRASVYGAKGDYAKAVADCNAALLFDPKCFQSLVYRGAAYMELQDFDRAFADFAGAIRIEPRDPEAYLLRSYAYCVKQDFAKSLADLGEAIRISPDRADAYMARADVHKRKQDYAKALADMDEAIRLEPDAEKYAARAECRESAGNIDGAIADLTEVLRLDPKSFDARSQRGRLYEGKKEYAKAKGDYAEAVRQKPDDTFTGYQFANLLTNCPDVALRDARRAAEIARDTCTKQQWKDTTWLELLAQTQARLGAFPDAVKYQKKAVAMIESARIYGNVPPPPPAPPPPGKAGTDVVIHFSEAVVWYDKAETREKMLAAARARLKQYEQGKADVTE
jgi:tetratricopeptide (TPR) repeat protein